MAWPVPISIPECEATFDTPLKNQSREAFQKNYPQGQFEWLEDQENIELYASDDAVHLTPKSASRFSAKIFDFITSREKKVLSKQDK